MANYHVTKQRDSDVWSIKHVGAKRISDPALPQKEAEQIAKLLSKNSGGGEVRIHRLDGKIRDSDTVAPGNSFCTFKNRTLITYGDKYYGKRERKTLGDDYRQYFAKRVA